jgi:hypothetical protein
MKAKKEGELALSFEDIKILDISIRPSWNAKSDISCFDDVFFIFSSKESCKLLRIREKKKYFEVHFSVLWG